MGVFVTGEEGEGGMYSRSVIVLRGHSNDPIKSTGGHLQPK